VYKRVSIFTTNNLIQEKKPIIFDARDAASYQDAHIPNAIFLSDQKLKSTVRRTARDRAILVYCYHGKASQDIAKLLADFGFSEVYSMDGGFESWRKEMPDAVRSLTESKRL
jgi:rhodanese-related sulfurtransferase